MFYLTVLNLPKGESFRWENVTVLGIVPSLDREPKDLWQFLEPAVDELKALWKRVRLRSCLSRFAITIHAAVISISSDVKPLQKSVDLRAIPR